MYDSSFRFHIKQNKQTNNKNNNNKKKLIQIGGSGNLVTAGIIECV